jgi:hypothetical protein
MKRCPKCGEPLKQAACASCGYLGAKTSSGCLIGAVSAALGLASIGSCAYVSSRDKSLAASGAPLREMAVSIACACGVGIVLIGIFIFMWGEH